MKLSMFCELDCFGSGMLKLLGSHGREPGDRSKDPPACAGGFLRAGARGLPANDTRREAPSPGLRPASPRGRSEADIGPSVFQAAYQMPLP